MRLEFGFLGMKILYTVGEFPKLSETFILNEIHELNRKGHEVTVFANSHPQEKITHEELEELDIRVYYKEFPTLSSIRDLFCKELLNTTVLDQAVLLDNPIYCAYWLHIGKQLIDTIDEENQIDLLHSHFVSPNRLATTYAAAYHDLPCTVTAHAYDIFGSFSDRRVKKTLENFDQVITPSKYNREYLQETFGVDTEISVVPPTTRVDKFQPTLDHEPGQLLTVARLVEKKGIEDAIDAVASLINSGYDVEYRIIGSGPREERLRSKVYDQGIGDHVTFLGNVTDDRLQEELRVAQVFVLPCTIASNGDRDASPVALKEAMAAQVPCVSTSISGIPEIVTDGQNGILVEPDSPSQVADAIATLVDQPELRDELAQNARQTVVSQFDISSSVDQLLEIFRSLVENNVETKATQAPESSGITRL